MNIVINTRFAAIHNWPDCPIDEVHFLRNPHRHEFHVKIKTSVNHDDRDIEIIQLKNKVDKFLNFNWHNQNLGHMSCEMMCRQISDAFNLNYVRVLEDGENGAEFIKG